MANQALNQKTFSLVTTTINVPRFLEAYAADAADHKRRIESFIVVGDRKTPAETARFCAEIQEKFGFPCRYISVQEQIDYLKPFPEFFSYLPWNCVQRRNIGLLIAYQGKADIVVTLDDDNFIHDVDYLGYHAHLGDIQEVTSLRSPTGWWNVCEMLESPDQPIFYHRGHPLSKRWQAEENDATESLHTARVVVNAGLWIDEPDIDALTRLTHPVHQARPSTKFRSRVGCSIGTWAPFNSQNTALCREIIPAYFLSPYIGRYDDIWASYVLRHIMDFLGDLVTYGAPLVRQERNPHDVFKDFDAERFGLEFNDVFIEALKSCRLTKTGYKGAFKEVSQQFPGTLKKTCESAKKDATLFANILRGIQLWSQLFDELK